MYYKLKNTNIMSKFNGSIVHYCKIFTDQAPPALNLKYITLSRFMSLVIIIIVHSSQNPT